jgi:polar amino acid transport system substrate-binding protein
VRIFAKLALGASMLLAVASTAAAFETITPGVLTIGTVTTYAPMEFRDPNTNELVGADIDLAKAIAKEMQLKIELVEVSFAQLMPSLQTGRIDIAMAGMSDRPSRREIANFLDYFRTGAQFYTFANRAAEIGGIENMCGKKVAYSRGAQWNDRVDAWSAENCTAKGKPAVVSVGAESTPDARTQLMSGRVDAVVQGSETIGHLQKLDPGKYAKIGGVFSDYLVGIPFLKNNAKADVLMTAVTKALTKLQADGTYDAILDRYGLKENAYKPLTVNQGT